MKKYRLTKITVQTREIISAQKLSTDEIQTAVCPMCHSPLAAVFPSAEKRPAELAPANLSGDRNKKLKGDL